MTTYDCILAILEYKNITKAAEHLYITQPALTLKIKRLEQKLGCNLFEPSNRTKLTPEGEVYIREMGKIIASEIRLNQTLQTMTEHRRKQAICIAIGFNRGKRTLPPLMERLTRLNDNIVFQIREATDGEMEDLVRTEQVDIAIMASTVISSSITALPLGRESLMLAVPQNSPLLSGSETLNDLEPILDPALLNNQVFLVGANTYGTAKLFHSMMQHFGIHPARLINIGNTQTAYLLAAIGMGIAPSFPELKDTPLPSPIMRRPIMCHIRDYPLTRQVFFLCKESRKDSPIIQQLYGQMKAYWDEIESVKT